MVNRIPRMEWEKSYLEALVDALRPSGDILEIGFNLGFAAKQIQSHQPKTHTIIEADPLLFAQAVQWAKNTSNVMVLHGSWQKILPELCQFDSIFFDDYSLGMDTRVLHATSHSEKELHKLIEMKIPQLSTIQYTDADLQLFYEEKGKQHPLETARFFSELHKRGQITTEQYERLIRDYNLEKTIPAKEVSAPFPPLKDNCSIFLEMCLKNHMRYGCRFSCFSDNPSSKCDNTWFFENIITNPDLDYQEQWMPVEVPESCTYYPYNTALILTIENKKCL
jgi:hypothetical protein